MKFDASHSGLGAALEQEIEKDVWVPIAFASRFLNDQEKKYSTNELELLAIVWSCEHFRTYLLGNHFVILSDHKAIISALKTNRGNKTHQSRLTRWADRLLPFDFDIFHISGGKLGIVDYLPRYPTFEAPRTSNFDEQYVVKCINRFFDARDFLDEWAKYHSPTKELLNITKISQNSVVSNKFGILSVEGALIQNTPSTSQRIKSIEGDKILDSKQIELSHQFNKSVLSPLEGVQIVGSNSGQSALRKIMPTFVTFSAWFTYYLPVLISLWIITLAVSNGDLLSPLIHFFASIL